MKLHIKDRIFIPQIMPKEGTFAEFSMKKEIINKIALTDKDKEKYKIVEKPDEKRVNWDSQKDYEEPLDVEFLKAEIEYLKKSCESLVDSAHPDELWLTVERIYNETSNK